MEVHWLSVFSKETSGKLEWELGLQGTPQGWALEQLLHAHNINHTYTRTHVCMRTRSCMHTWILQNKDKLLHSRPLGLEIQSINASTRQTLTIMKTKSLTLEVIRLSFKMQNVIAHLQSVIAWPHLLLGVPKPSYPRGETRTLLQCFPSHWPPMTILFMAEERWGASTCSSSSYGCGLLMTMSLLISTWFQGKATLFCSIWCMFLVAGEFPGGEELAVVIICNIP